MIITIFSPPDGPALLEKTLSLRTAYPKEMERGVIDKESNVLFVRVELQEERKKTYVARLPDAVDVKVDLPSNETHLLSRSLDT